MDDKLQTLAWLPDLMEQVRERLAELREDQHDLRPDLQQEYQQLEANTKGWSASLANPDLAAALRRTIEERYGAALEHMETIERTLAEQDSQGERADKLLDPLEVLNRLECLSEVLANNNPTLGNLELSLHIDKIICSPDGSVVMRTCKLGGLTDVVELLAEESERVDIVKGGHEPERQAKPRRRGRARLGDADDERDELRALSEFAAGTDRFAGLPEEWFWHDEFFIPEKTWPFQEMAITMATDRLAGLTQEELAEKYGMTLPTIRKSLKHAAEIDERFGNMPKKMARARWHEDHAAEVAALKKAQGLNTQQLVDHFGKTDTTIRKALQHARK